MEPAASSMFSALRKEVKELKAFLGQIDGRLKVIEATLDYKKGNYRRVACVPLYEDPNTSKHTQQQLAESWPYTPDIIDKLGQD